MCLEVKSDIHMFKDNDCQCCISSYSKERDVTDLEMEKTFYQRDLKGLLMLCIEFACLTDNKFKLPYMFFILAKQ